MQVKLLKHLKFLFSSTNQHGVHSPFVFEYLTKCLYQKKKYPKSKTIDILLKSISYFEYKNLQIKGNTKVQDVVKQTFKNCDFEQFPLDLIYVEKLSPDLLSRLSSEEQIHNDSMVLINNIHTNKNTTALWNQIIAMEKATATIDFFYCGAIFFRQEQVKEHFKVRI